jgi:diphosphomevalonate decarboxylase
VTGQGKAIAHPNIALAKYWGKLEGPGNLPSVPSLSITLDGMATTTDVRFEADLHEDTLRLDGDDASGRPRERVTELLDALWVRSSALGPVADRPRARVESANDFPTASGLASSASAFAALAVAANEAAGAGLPTAALSDLARRISASSARSFFGGFVELAAGQHAVQALPAQALAPASHWPLRLLVAVTDEGQKKVGSTVGMLRTAATSPYYAAWVEAAPRLFDAVRAAVLARDFDALIGPVEQSALAMHATSIAAAPGIIYWNQATMAAIERVRALRARGTPACFTIDAGPHVKVLTPEAHVAEVGAALQDVPGVLRIIAARPGEGARVLVAAP